MTRLLNAKEVAEMLSVRPSWVYAEARANRIPHIRLGRYTRFNPASIEAWAASGSEGRRRRSFNRDLAAEIESWLTELPRPLAATDVGRQESAAAVRQIKLEEES